MRTGTPWSRRSAAAATVLLAEDLKHRRKVAIKVLRPELSVTLATARLLNEIQIAAGRITPTS